VVGASDTGISFI
jgi:hypothetical protein